MLNLPSVQKNVSRAAPNGNPDKAPRAAREELAGRIWPAGRRLPTSALITCQLWTSRRHCLTTVYVAAQNSDVETNNSHLGGNDGL